MPDTYPALDQSPFPVLSTNKALRCTFGDSKWYHCEEETVVEILAEYALEKGAWSAIPWREFLSRSKKEIVFSPWGSLDEAIGKMLLTGDIGLIYNGDINPVFIVPLPKLGETIKQAGTYLWFKK